MNGYSTESSLARRLTFVLAFAVLELSPAHASQGTETFLGNQKSQSGKNTTEAHALSRATTNNFAPVNRYKTNSFGNNPIPAQARKRPRRIVDGEATFAFPAAGALLFGSNPSTAKLICSGTLIGCDRFLTAAHCVHKQADPKKYKVFFQNAGFHNVININWPEDYKGSEDPSGDLAILTLEKPVDGISSIQANYHAEPSYGTEGVIVGFGRTAGSSNDFGIKRQGFVRTAACSPKLPKAGLICWNFASAGGLKSSNTCEADSGGGLYIEQKTNNQNNSIIIGTTIGGLRPNCLSGDHSYDSDLYHYRKWIGENNSSNVSKQCGNLSIDVDRHVFGSLLLLNAATPEIVKNFVVPQGLAQLRVAVNGEGNSDFDLYVTEGKETNSKKAHCEENGEGQFGYCAFANPAAGPWQIIVRRKKGDGLAQLTVTQVPK